MQDHSHTWRRAGEEQLDHHPNDVHVAEAPGEDRKGARRPPDEDDDRADHGGTKVDEAVREPGQHVQDDMLVRRQDVAQVRAVKDILEGGKDADPDRGPIVTRNEPVRSRSAFLGLSRHARPEGRGRGRGRGFRRDAPASVEENEPIQDGQHGQEELSGEGQQEGEGDERGDGGLDQGPGGFDDGEREDAHEGQQDILAIVVRPAMGAEGPQRVGGRERGLQGGQGGGGRLSTPQSRTQLPADSVGDDDGHRRPRHGESRLHRGDKGVLGPGRKISGRRRRRGARLHGRRRRPSVPQPLNPPDDPRTLVFPPATAGVFPHADETPFHTRARRRARCLGRGKTMKVLPTVERAMVVEGGCADRKRPGTVGW